VKIKAFLALLWWCCILSPALGQTPDNKDDDVVKISTNLVQVDVVVTKDGKPVPNLTAEDFELFQDGKRQAITSFAYISNVSNPTAAPVEKGTTGVTPYVRLQPGEARRIIAFVVDDLGLSAESMVQVRRQLRKFVNEQLQPNDLIAIVRTGSELGALQQFTNDKRLLTRAVEQLRWNMCNRVGISVLRPFMAGSANSSSDVPVCGYRTYAMTLKSLRFIIDSMGYLPGRKSMVLLSDSVPRESQDEMFPERGVLRDAEIVKNDPLNLPPDSTNYSFSLQKLAEKAIRNSVVIYSVDTQGLQYTGPTAADSFGSGNPRQMMNVMSQRSQLLYSRREGGELIAKQTGGFQIRNSNSYGFDRIMADQSGYYLLGYRPTDETFNRRFHQIKAKLKRGGMSVRTRFGFFGVTEEEAKRAAPSSRDLTNIALASPFVAQDIEVDLTSFFADDKTSGPVVRSFVYIDAQNVTLTQIEGRYQGALELHGVIYGDNGTIVQHISQGANLSLSNEDYEQAMRYGMGVGFDMPVKRTGSFQVRVVAKDKTSSKIGSAGQFVVVPDLKNKKMAVSGIVLGENGADQTIANPGSRRFLPNSELYFAYFLYNAANETGKLRNLVMNAMLFRDGKNVYSGPELVIAASDPTNLKRVFVNGVIKLGPELEPGNYYLQVTVTDKDANKKAAPVVQWVDFFIEKQ
jgi:VWFA-related protein